MNEEKLVEDIPDELDKAIVEFIANNYENFQGNIFNLNNKIIIVIKEKVGLNNILN